MSQPPLVTTAITEQIPHPSFPMDGGTAGILGTGVMSLVLGLLWLRRKTSRDGAEIIKDRAEGQLVESLLKDRDAAWAMAREAMLGRDVLSLELGQLRAEVKYLTESLRVSQETIAEIRRGVMSVGQKVDAVQDHMNETSQKLSASGRAPL